MALMHSPRNVFSWQISAYIGLNGNKVLKAQSFLDVFMSYHLLSLEIIRRQQPVFRMFGLRVVEYLV